MRYYIIAFISAAACEQREPTEPPPAVEDTSCVSDFETPGMFSAGMIFTWMVMPGADCRSSADDYLLNRIYWTDWWNDPLVCGNVSCLDMPIADGYDVVTDDGAKFTFGANCGPVTDPSFLDDSGQLRLAFSGSLPEWCDDD